MLLEKVRAYSGSAASSQSKNTHKLENGLGLKVPGWMGKELTKWAEHFDIVDTNGKPLAYVTKDLLDEKPEFNEFTVSAFLDKKASRQIATQIALLSRLRAVFLKNDDTETLSKVAKAVKQSQKLEDVWEKKPTWWDDYTEDAAIQHNFLLLKRLAEQGFLNVLNDASGFGPADTVRVVEIKMLPFDIFGLTC